MKLIGHTLIFVVLLITISGGLFIIKTVTESEVKIIGLVNKSFKDAIIKESEKRIKDKKIPFASRKIGNEETNIPKKFTVKGPWGIRIIHNADSLNFSEIVQVTRQTALRIKNPIEVTQLDSLFRLELLKNDLDLSTLVYYKDTIADKEYISNPDTSLFKSKIRTNLIKTGIDKEIILQAFVSYPYKTIYSASTKIVLPYAIAFVFIPLLGHFMYKIKQKFFQPRITPKYINEATNEKPDISTSSGINPIEETNYPNIADPPINIIEKIPIKNDVSETMISTTIINLHPNIAVNLPDSIPSTLSAKNTLQHIKTRNNDIHLKEKGYIFYYLEQEITLTHQQFSILKLFLSNAPEMLLMHEEIAIPMWNYCHLPSLNKAMERFRKGLKAIPCIELKTIKGQGYKLIIPEIEKLANPFVINLGEEKKKEEEVAGEENICAVMPDNIQ